MKFGGRTRGQQAGKAGGSLWQGKIQQQGLGKKRKREGHEVFIREKDRQFLATDIDKMLGERQWRVCGWSCQ